MSFGLSRREYRDELDIMTVSGCISWIAVIANFLHWSHIFMARVLSMLELPIFIGEHADFMIVTSFQCRDSAISFNAGNHCAACESPKRTTLDSGLEISPKAHTLRLVSLAPIGLASHPVKRRYIVAYLVEFAELRRMVQCHPLNRESTDTYHPG